MEVLMLMFGILMVLIKKTGVTTKRFSYTDTMNVPLRNDANMDGASEIIVRCLKQPTVSNVKIEDGNVLLDIEKRNGR